MPLKSCMVAIEPVQSGSGDPSPSNVRPISGLTECNVTRDGENHWDEQWEVGTIKDNDGSNYPSDSRIRSKNYIPVKANTTYYFCVTREVTANNYRFYYYDKNKNFIEASPTWLYRNITFTTPSNACYMRFTEANNTTSSNDISINYPSTDTSYHAYTGNTYNIEFPSEAGTVYGGTLDVTNGVLTVDRAIVDGGDLTWTYWTGNNFYSTTISSTKTANATNDILCSVYPNGNISTKGIYNMVESNAQKGYVYINDSDYSHDSTGASQLKSDLEGSKICYRLKTPTTYNLTPTEVKTLLGINNIFADTGDVLNAEYTRDASIIINELLERVIALEQGA